jgi:hypothetical protein
MIFRYRAHLEAELLRQETLLKFVIQDKERAIHRLEEEVARLRAQNERFALALVPRPHVRAGDKPLGAPITKQGAGETSWQNYLKQHMETEEKLIEKAKEQADVQGQTGTGLHEPSGGAKVGSNGGERAEAKSAASGAA